MIDVGTIADAGVVYVYSEVGAQAELAINNPQAAINDEFGSAVAVAANGDIIASARMIDNNAVDDGSVFVHDGLTGSLIWSVANPIADVSGLFGTSLAGSPQGNVIVGAANDDSGATNTGKVFVFNGSDGGLIDFINAPDVVNNGNFGQGLAVTDSGQIAVGAFGVNGGFGKLYLFTSVGTGPSQPLLNEQPFSDPALQSCVLDQAAPNGWALASEVTTLDCADLGITDLTGLAALTELTSLNLANNDLVDIQALESLSNLTGLDLTGNEAIACGDLDSLDILLGQGVVTRPIACVGGSGISNQRVQNLHNALGQRAVKSVDGGAAGTIHFIYDQSGQVIAEMDAATGMTLREYIYVNGVQVALVDDTGTQDEAVYYVHTDHLATPQKITDSQQTVVWSGSYEPFGEVEETVASIENNIRFPGQYADGETGLHYNYFRDYDPSLGRYVESDLIGLTGGLNTYVYANQSPRMNSDQLGLFVCPWCVAAAVGVAFDVAGQLSRNGGNWRDIDLVEAGAAGLTSALLPGALQVGKGLILNGAKRSGATIAGFLGGNAVRKYYDEVPPEMDGPTGRVTIPLGLFFPGRAPSIEQPNPWKKSPIPLRPEICNWL